MKYPISGSFKPKALFPGQNFKKGFKADLTVKDKLLIMSNFAEVKTRLEIAKDVRYEFLI